METHSLCDCDRALLVGLTDAMNRLSSALEMNRTERVYSCKEVAIILGRSQQTISRYIKQGKIQKAVRGGAVGIPESELDKLRNINH